VSSPAASDDTTDNEPPIVFVPRPRENRDPSLCIVPEEVAIPPPAGQPGHGSGAVLRRQPVRIVDGHVEGGYTDMYELLCPSYATPICDRTATNCFHAQASSSRSVIGSTGQTAGQLRYARPRRGSSPEAGSS